MCKEETGKTENAGKNVRLGKYRIIKKLGQGGEGCVYLAQDESLSRLVAVKRLWDQGKKETRGEGNAGRETERIRQGEEPRQEKESRQEKEIRQEAAFLRDLRHPMLPVVYELFYEEGWYLVMEYMEGISLHNYIQTQGPIGEEQGRIWGVALLDVLAYLHTRETPVIYRDFKPDNIVVCRDKTLRLVDFGAAVFHRFGEDGDGRMAYTAGFAAPEQMGTGGGKARADERSDIYAFGKTLYYMFTGVEPGSPPDTVLSVYAYNPLLSGELERIIRRCIAEDPKARYQVAAEVMRDLEKRERHRDGRRREFVRHVEKQICLTGSFHI